MQNQIVPQGPNYYQTPQYQYQPAKQQYDKDSFAALEQMDSVTFKPTPNLCTCMCCCKPKYTFNETIGDRELGDELYKAKPTRNCYWLCYNTEIRNQTDSKLIESKRPLNCLNCCGLCCLDLYNSEGSGVRGKERMPYCCANCCLPGSFVYVDDQEKYFIGMHKKYFCFGGEKVNVVDIWNAEKTQRIGAIYMFIRSNFCVDMYPIACICPACCNCYQFWKKIVFPKNIPYADRAMILTAVLNGYGESRGCCIPFQLPIW